MKEFFFKGDKLNRLAARMQKGDQGAAEALYAELATKVFGFCMSRLREREVAEDLTQEIFLKLVSRIDTFDPAKGHFTVWFWQMARNTLVDYYRREKTIPFSGLGDDMRVETLAIHENPEEDFEKKFEKQRLDQFLNSLDAHEQELFRLRYLADLSYREMSAILGKAEGTLRVAVSRLKKKIRTLSKTIMS